MQKSCPKRGSLRLVLFTYVLRSFMLFRRSFSKPHRCASARGDAFTADPHFEFGLRLRFCSQHPPLQNSSQQRLHFRVRLRLQNSDLGAGSKLKCETSLQNAECRVPRGQENEVGECEFKFRLRLQSRSLGRVYVSLRSSSASSEL